MRIHPYSSLKVEEEQSLEDQASHVSEKENSKAEANMNEEAVFCEAVEGDDGNNGSRGREERRYCAQLQAFEEWWQDARSLTVFEHWLCAVVLNAIGDTFLLLKHVGLQRSPADRPRSCSSSRHTR